MVLWEEQATAAALFYFYFLQLQRIVMERLKYCSSNDTVDVFDKNQIEADWQMDTGCNLDRAAQSQQI